MVSVLIIGPKKKDVLPDLDSNTASNGFHVWMIRWSKLIFGATIGLFGKYSNWTRIPTTDSNLYVRSTTGRKVSYEKSAMTVSLKLGGAPTVEKVDEAFISNVPITQDTPSLLDDRWGS